MLNPHCLLCLVAFTISITHESIYSSPSLLDEYLWYDKLWGPSQRVITLFPASESTISHFKPDSHFPISEHLDLINSHITKRYFATSPSL